MAAMAAKKDSTSDAAAAADAPPDNSAARPAKRAKKSKKEKKSKKRRRDSEDDAAAAASTEPPPPSNDPPADDDKAARRAARAAKKAAKAAAKSEVLDRLPKVDGDGIPYSKLQIRRMLRRVKHGLPPLATEEEEQEIRRREKRERIEEEALYSATADDAGGVDEGDDGEGDVAIAGEDRENEPHEPEAVEEDHSDDNEEEAADNEPKRKYHNPPSKKTKRSKPVPPDYVCMACNNELDNFTPHWIYDCPQKKTQKGCNQVAKKLRGLHDPPERKVFVSGLPFDCDEGLVKRYFEEGMREKHGADGEDDGETGGAWGEEHDMVHCKLLKFEDSKRCKGTGFLTFGGDAGAQLALKLNGAVWKEVEEPGTASKKTKKKGAKGGEEKEHKELRLKVAKVLNRRVTKMKRGKK